MVLASTGGYGWIACVPQPRWVIWGGANLFSSGITCISTEPRHTRPLLDNAPRTSRCTEQKSRPGLRFDELRVAGSPTLSGGCRRITLSCGLWNWDCGSGQPATPGRLCRWLSRLPRQALWLPGVFPCPVSPFPWNCSVMSGLELIAAVVAACRSARIRKSEKIPAANVKSH